MALEKITSTDVWMRLVNTEYDDLSPANLEEKFKYIYLEETGEVFEGELKMFHSSEAKSVDPELTGYDGTALLISEGEEEELFVINQGTQSDTMIDWAYNVKGAYLGQTVDQAQAARDFTNEAKSHFAIDEEVKVNSLGHSLGNQNGTVTGISDGTYDSMYGLNGLQVSPYSQYKYDFLFADEVRKEFGLVNEDGIYNIPKEDLVDFTQEYFKDSGVKIHQVISTDDPLYGITERIGLAPMGKIEYIDTNPELAGIKTVIDDIPEDVLQEFVDLGILYAKADADGGIGEVLEQTLGVNYEYIKDLNSLESLGNWYLFDQEELDDTLKAVDESLPPLIDKLNIITDNSEAIFGRLYEEGYITEKQKTIMIDEIAKLAKELETVQNAISQNVEADESGGFFDKIKADGDLIMDIVKVWIAFNEAMKNIKDSGIMESLGSIVDSHSINELLNAKAGGNKSYIGKDMVLTSNRGGGTPIKVNMSAALRLYREGTTSLEDKTRYLTDLEKAVHAEVALTYLERRSKIMSEIGHIEANPKSYAVLLEEHKYPTYKVESARVNEIINPLTNADLEEVMIEMRKSVDSGYIYLNTYKEAITKLFKEEEDLLKLFDLVREM
ncbi:hypothetical protein SAMN05421663_10581 [Terribacillus halophilus]|uniref:DUF6792 domain-containing protein n=1 Tax=Terribacillus halophilus TaxID=361279 RepID=A0A1G6QHB2_9BACI|nr:DUF6792 domain-containing protein [Terribacillus halophilus]SDC91713.1 hypothetical protein SAMN05421663_10581 [Terribacillus halophilus]